MLQVLVADDEIKILQLITHLVRWEDYGMEIVGTATDGNQAFLKISELEPDVVITDIRMPNISGVELVEKVHEMDLHPYFIIVSGYSDFSYAQKAIKLGVEDYLLKPLKRRELDAVLRKIQEKSGAVMEKAAKEKALTSALNRVQGKLKDNILSDLLIRKRSGITSLSNQELNEEYGIEWSGSLFLPFILHLYPEDIENPDTVREELQFVLPKLKKEASQRIEPLCCEYVSIIRDREILCLLNFNRENRREIEEHLNRLKINILNYRSIYPNMQIVLALGPEFTSFSDTLRGFQGAGETLKRRFDRQGAFFLSYREFKVSPVPAISLIPSNERALVKLQIETMDRNGLADSLSDIGARLSGHLDDGLLLCQCYDIVSDLFLISISSQISTEERIQLREQISGYLNVFSDFTTIWSYLEKICLEKIDGIAASRKDSEHLPVRQAKEYIRKHFDMPISLESVSREIGFNPAYFSSLFKKETGQNFSEYLTGIRMENAKHMLKQSTKDVGEIAIACGYNDVKYFSKLFKKATHITPSEYRKLYG